MCACPIDARSAGGGIGFVQRLALAETANRILPQAEAPGINAQPAEILRPLPQMRQFPIEHCRKAGRIDDEIAAAEIAMDNGAGRCRAAALGEPGQRQVEHRRIDAERAVMRRHPGEAFIDAPGRQLEIGDFGERDTVQPRQHTGTLAGHRGAGDGKAIAFQPFRRERFTFDARHHEAGTQPVAGFEDGDHFGDRNTMRAGATLQRRLMCLGQAARRFGPGGGALQDQRPIGAIAHRIDGKGGGGGAP
jgi:hypothetical protein